MKGFSSAAWTVAIPRDGSSRVAGLDIASKQPVDVFRDRSCVVVFAGALYNRAELDERFGASSCDSERVLRVFRSVPDRFATELRGIFAILIQDAISGEIVAARDRVGIIPLFFADAGRDIVFSPSIRLLGARPDVSRELNRVFIAEQLSDFWTRPDETYFKGLRRVQPATVMRVVGRVETSVRYWNFAEEPIEREPESALANFRKLLTAAVSRPMEMGKSGVFLSGGVDSISVAAVAREVANSCQLSPPTALSLYYRDSDANEEDAQKFVAAQLGMASEAASLDEALDGGSAMEAMLKASPDWPIPMFNIYLPAFLRLGARGRDAGCEVIFTGGGGDEWLGVGPSLASDYLRTLRLGAYVKFILHMRRSYLLPYRDLLRSLVWTFGFKQLAIGARNHILPALGHDLDASRARRALPDWLAPDPALRRDIVERLTQAKRDERLARNAAPSLYVHESRRSIAHPIVVSEIENKFLMGEALGVSFFEPYWDADLIDLLYRVEPDILASGGIAKGLVHKLLQESLPAFKVAKQKKVAFGNFFRNKVRREAEAAWRYMGGVPALAGLGLVDEKKFSAMVEKMLAEPASYGIWVIPHVLTVEAWVRGR